MRNSIVGLAVAIGLSTVAFAYEPPVKDDLHANRWGFFRANFAYGDVGPVTTTIYQVFNLNPLAGSQAFWVLKRLQPKVNNYVFWADSRNCLAINDTIKSFGLIPAISVQTPYNPPVRGAAPIDRYSEGLGFTLNAPAAFVLSRYFGQVEFDAGPESPLAQAIAHADEKLNACWRRTAPTGNIKGLD